MYGPFGKEFGIGDYPDIAHMDVATIGRLVRLRSRANASARSMRSRGTGRAAREAAEKEWAEARREAERLVRGKPHEPQKGETKISPSENGGRKKTPPKPKTAPKAEAAPRPGVSRPERVKTSGRIKLPKKRVEVTKVMTEKKVSPSKETASTSESATGRGELVESINRAYEMLKSTNRDLARAAYALEAHQKRMRIENAEALLEAKNARAMDMYLEGLTDNEEYRTLVMKKTRAELAHFDAKAEVERIKLLVRLMEATTDDSN